MPTIPQLPNDLALVRLTIIAARWCLEKYLWLLPPHHCGIRLCFPDTEWTMLLELSDTMVTWCKTLTVHSTTTPLMITAFKGNHAAVAFWEKENVSSANLLLEGVQAAYPVTDLMMADRFNFHRLWKRNGWLQKDEGPRASAATESLSSYILSQILESGLLADLLQTTLQNQRQFSL